MADENSRPWRLFFFFFLFSSLQMIPLCLAQSSSPLNIEVFFPPPSPILPPPPPPTSLDSPPPISAPSPESAPGGSSNGKKIATAVAATAASTLVVTGLAFLLIKRTIVAKRKRLQAGPPGAGVVAGGGGGRAMALQSRSSYVKYQGEVKGFIVDENGLDVLYWRKLEKRNCNNNLTKEVLNNNKAIQEVPLLRDRSSTSHLKDRNRDDEGDVNGVTASDRPPSAGVVFRETEIPSSRSSSGSGPPPVSAPPTPAVSFLAVPKKAAAPPPPPVAPPPPPPPPPPAPKARSSNAAPRPPAPPPAKGKAAAAAEKDSGEGVAAQVKMKALHWDKVNMANAEHSMVWDKINSDSGSFRFDGDLMEALFGYVATNKNPTNNTNTEAKPNPITIQPSQTFILETRKSQNIAIVLRSLYVSRKEVIDALMEGIGLSQESLEKLSRITPTEEEQSQILEYSGDPAHLADAESFLFHVLRSVPSAFARLDAMLFRSVTGSEIAHLRDSIHTLEKACQELWTRGLFLKLLEAVLKAGNRMNAGTSRGNALAFDLTSLGRLADVRSTDGKTTLLHFVVEEVVRSEGKRCALNRDRSAFTRTLSAKLSGVEKEERSREYTTLGLPVVGGLSSEFSNVKKAAAIDHESFSGVVPGLMRRASEIRKTIVSQSVKGGFAREMEGFLESTEEELKRVGEEKERALESVKKTTEYYQAGAWNKRKESRPFQLFVIVRDFLVMVDQVCVEIARNMQRNHKRTWNNNNNNSNNNVNGDNNVVHNRNSGSAAARPEKVSVRFANLPENFMSGRSSSDSDDDE